MIAIIKAPQNKQAQDALVQKEQERIWWITNRIPIFIGPALVFLFMVVVCHQVYASRRNRVAFAVHEAKAAAFRENLRRTMEEAHSKHEEAELRREEERRQEEQWRQEQEVRERDIALRREQEERQWALAERQPPSGDILPLPQWQQPEPAKEVPVAIAALAQDAQHKMFEEDRQQRAQEGESIENNTWPNGQYEKKIHNHRMPSDFPTRFWRWSRWVAGVAVLAAIFGALRLKSAQNFDQEITSVGIIALAIVVGLLLLLTYGIGLLIAWRRKARTAQYTNSTAPGEAYSFAGAAPAGPPETRAQALRRGRRHPAYILVRLGLAAIAATGAWFAFERLAFTIEEVRHGGFDDASLTDQKLRDTLLGEVSTAVATMNFDEAILEAVREEDMQRAEVLHGLAGSLGRRISPSTEEAYQNAMGLWSTAWRWARDAAAGAVTGQSGSLPGLAGAIAADVALAPAGDLRDAGIQLAAIAQGKDPDDIILGLAVVGIALYTLDRFGGENVKGIKAGQATMKAGLRFSKASVHLTRDIRRVVGTAVDMPGLKTWARTSFRNLDVTNAADVTRFVKRSALDEIGQVADHMKTIFDNGGGSAVMVSLKSAENIADLARYRRATRVLGKDADKAFVVLGRRMQQAFKVWHVTAPTVAKITAWFSALAASVMLLLASLFQSVALRLARVGLMRRFALWLAGAPQT